MTLETLVQLARSRTPADRSRIQLATAALGLSGALLLGALHQRELGGARLYPLDGEDFLDHVVHGFVRAYRAG